MGTFAITNAHVVPVCGDTFTGTVLVTDSVITALGTDVTIPGIAEAIDVPGH